MSKLIQTKEESTSPNLWTVVLIEDNEADSLYIKSLTRKIGCAEFISYQSAEDAFDDIETLKSASCILLDHSLPEMNGLECLLELSDMETSPPIIMLSGCHDEVVVIESLKNGAHDYLVKDDLTLNALKRSMSNTIEKHKIQQDLERKNAEARHFAAILSHDLKSPMRVISLVSEHLHQTLQSDDPNKQECVEMCGEIHKNSTYIKNLINGLIVFMQNGRDQKNFMDVDLNDILKRITGAISASTVKDENAPTITIDNLPTIFGDKVGLGQVFQNLLDNAIKYCEKNPEITVTYQDTDTHHSIFITDNGIGIAPEHHKKIFTPLHRLHNRERYEGSGIGLSLVKKIIEQHKGNISIDSNVGEGSTFRINLLK